MNLFPLKATSTYLKAYYAALVQFHQGGHTTEGNRRSAFADVLKRCASAYEWHLIELSIAVKSFFFGVAPLHVVYT